MLRSVSYAGAGPLALAVLLALAGCGPSFDVEPDDAAACAGVRCTAGTCFSNGGQPMCRCGAWEEAAGLLCQVASFVVPDDHAGSPGEATVLTAMGTPAEGRISASTRGQLDRDLFTFTAAPGHTYVFLCQPGSLPRCQPRLLDGSGRQVTGLFLDAERTAWSFKPRGEGPWYIEVSGAGDTGTYSYQLLDQGPDDFEDSPAQAGGKEPSDTSFTVTSAFVGDNDVLQFHARAGHAYRLGCELPTDEVGVMLRLLDGSGRTVDSTSGVGTRRMPELEMHARSAGTWFMQVSPTFGPMPVTFRCWLKDLGLDDHGDTWNTATRLTPGVPVPVRLHTRKDVDALAFTARAGHSYVLKQRPHVVASLQLFDAHERRLGPVNPFWYVLESATAGEYVLRVMPPAVGSLDPPFELWLEDLGPDDHGDTPANATRAPVGEPVEARPHGASDPDVLAFEVEERGVYQASCVPACRMKVEGPYQGGYTTSREVQAERLDVSASGMLYLSVAPVRALEPYTVKLEWVGIDDHPDDVTDSTPALTPPAYVTGGLEAENDVDAFAVMLEAGRSYGVELTFGKWVSLQPPEGAPTVFRGSGYLIAPVTGRYTLRVGYDSGWYRQWELRLRTW